MTEEEQLDAWDATLTVKSVVTLAIIAMDDLELEKPRNIEIFTSLRSVLRDASPKLDMVMQTLDLVPTSEPTEH
ncbi:hypothetical protein [uncultured Agrobacterium sp.]|uniref:hypothetical protein n=1 Tax=uncultured Agrobacterium sp. TaxID=157277 RepID=UPI002586CC7F|nr:hypothetical protein [uncultured Agrobacterium sp.]